MSYNKTDIQREESHVKMKAETGILPMVNIEIRLIIFFVAEDRDALYSQQKQDWEVTVAQTMNFLL